MKRKKILIIGTGGTIASVKTKQGLRPAYKTEEIISFFPEVKNIADIKGIMLFNLDSTNMQPDDWSKMADTIEKYYKEYDGFIITHGTDTMHYSASALSLMLQNLSKPVVFTGSVKAIGKESDAKQNFMDAVIVASSDINEVCIVFHSRIIRGSRARKTTNEATRIADKNLGVYSSINCHLVGELIGKLEGVYDRKIILNPEYRHVKNNSRRLKALTKISANVALIKIYPGFDPLILLKLDDKDCIIIEAFGPGNLPFMKNTPLDAIKDLSERGVSVFVTTQNPFGEVNMDLYEVGKQAQKAGAISCYDMTSETALVKAMWILGNFGNEKDAVIKLMHKNFTGEING